MFKKPNRLAISLLLLAGPVLSAQGAANEVAGILPEIEITVEYVPGSDIVPVAEDGVEEGKDPAVPKTAEERMLVNDFKLFKQLMDDRVHDEADTVAKRLVELAIRVKGRHSNEFANALTNLAIVQYRTDQLDSAQQNFKTAIETIEENEGRLDERLVNPLKGFGVIQLESGHPDRASRTFKRAVHVTHVNQGPHNRGQMESLESIAEIHLRMGDRELAHESQDTILALNIREYGLDSLELVPSLMRRAAWQHRVGAIYGSRTTYRRVVQIVEENLGRNDLQLVEPLILLGQSFFCIDTFKKEIFHEERKSTSEIYFRRAARIATEHPDTTWQVASRATLALGDYYMIDNYSRHGREVYREAWDLLSEDGSRLNVRREQLEGVVPLRQHKLPQYINASDRAGKLRSDDPLLQGKIAMSYEISILGRATEFKMIEAEPPEFTDMQGSVQREMRRRIYRPRFENGKAVRTPNQLLMHEFFYRRSDLESAKIAAASGGNK